MLGGVTNFSCPPDLEDCYTYTYFGLGVFTDLSSHSSYKHKMLELNLLSPEKVIYKRRIKK